MSRELWAVERCEHGLIEKHGSPEGTLIKGSILCSGGSRKPLDFDAIWDRYREAVMWADLTLTYDELKQVVYGE